MNCFSFSPEYFLYIFFSSFIELNSVILPFIIVFSPFINFYDKNQSLIATVKTDTGIIFQKTGKFHARGNVVINTIDNTKLYTDTLLWDNERKLIITDGYVEVYTSTGKITAVGMESDAFLKKITFKKDIKGETNIVPQ